MRRMIRNLTKKYEDAETSYLLQKKGRELQRIPQKYRGLLKKYRAFLLKNPKKENFVLEFYKFLDLEYKFMSKDDGELHFAKALLNRAFFDCLLKNEKEPYADYFSYILELMKESEKIDFENVYFKYSLTNKILEKRNVYHYHLSDKESKNTVRTLVHQFARRHRLSDSDGARLFTEEKEEQYRRKRRRKYGIALVIFPLILYILVFLYCGFAEFLLLLFPIFILSYELLSVFASLAVKPLPFLKTNDHVIRHPVLVTIPTILKNEKDVLQFTEKMEELYFQNPQEGIYFSVLGDYKESTIQSEVADEEIKALAKKETEKLNEKYGNRFLFLIRGRQKSFTENCYMGWERKRGALIELVRAIKGKETSFEEIFGFDGALSKIEYILTLDSDTNARMDGVLTMYRAMRHPENKPEIHQGIVTKGYGVIEPGMAPSVAASSSTPFAMMIEGGGGIDSYESAHFDFYESIFSKAAFCGKGMFDVEVFYRVIDSAFPDGKILSHDLLEGTRLRCGYMGELTFTDSCPSNALSYFKRAERWLRGDLQSAPFSMKYLPFENEKKKNRIDSFSRFMILLNVIRAVTPIFAFLSLLFASFLEEAECEFFLFLSFSYLLFPLFYTVLRSFKTLHRKFRSKTLQSLWQSVLKSLYVLSSLPYQAKLSFSCLVKVLYRSLFSGKHLLEWVTSAEGEQKYKKSDSRMKLFLLYQKKMAISIVSGLFFLLFGDGGILRLLGLLFLLFPTVSYFLSKPFQEKKSLSKDDKEYLISRAEESYRYYKEFVTKEHHDLPPDNYQEYPVKRVASRTSPTNIGMFLLSIASMYLLEKEDYKTAVTSIENTVATLEKLPKFHGHLYNWYDTKTLEILSTPFISTVDSGNLMLSLEIVKNTFPKEKELQSRIEKLIDDTDFSFLFVKKAQLLSVGYDVSTGKLSEHLYDLYFSEARSAYYFAISKRQIPVSAFGALSKPLVSKNGYVGILSWSGTTFEYFMPHLFLPLYENTMEYEALSFAFHSEKKEAFSGVYGVSESAYFQFDEKMNYQYRAFGSQNLCLDPNMPRDRVIAPYASFLFALLKGEEVIKNLKNLEKLGAKGEFGFYEALDFTSARVGRGYALVRSYMAHHVGMMIAATCNVVKNEILVIKLFENKEYKAAAELLEEKIPLDTPVSKDVKAGISKDHSFSFLSHHVDEKIVLDKEMPFYSLVTKDGSTVVAEKSGKIFLSYDNLLLNDPFSQYSFELLLKMENQTVPVLKENNHFQRENDTLIYEYKKEEMKVRTSFEIENKNLFVVTIEGLEADFDRKIELNTKLGFFTREELLTHPSFGGLFIESFYLEKENILVFKKRRKSSKENDLYFGFSFRNNEKFLFKTSVDHVNQPYLCKVGAVRSPYLGIEKNIDQNRPFHFEILFGIGTTKEELIKTMNSLKYGKKQKEIKEERTVKEEVFSSMLLSFVYEKKKIKSGLPSVPVSELYKRRISGDRPIFTFILRGKQLNLQQKDILFHLMKSKEQLNFAGIHFDLAFYYEEDDSYYARKGKELSSFVSKIVGNIRMNESVFLFHRKEDWKVLQAASKIIVEIKEDTIPESLVRSWNRFLISKEDEILYTENLQKEGIQGGFNTPYGSFLKDGFLMNQKRNDIPFSYIYANSSFGTLLTTDSFGFTFFKNAGELRLTPFKGAPDRKESGELLLLEIEKKRYDLCKSANFTVFFRSNATYYGEIEGLPYEISVGVHPKFPLKLVTFRIKNNNMEESTFKINYEIVPLLHQKDKEKVTCFKEGSTIFYKRTVSYFDGNFVMYLDEGQKEMTLQSGEEKEGYFLLGAFNSKNDRTLYDVKNRFHNVARIKTAFLDYKKDVLKFVSRFQLLEGPKELKTLFNLYLPYQVWKVRLEARASYYQPGGAYGFRDQLQDAFALLPYDEKLLERQIYRSAAHQYDEGDVEHWWHPLPKKSIDCDRGIRTRCSDDLLWLPFLLGKYLKFSSSKEILDKEIYYLKSEILKDTEEDRYEQPVKGTKGTLYQHALRSLDRALLRLSKRKLAMMGSSDWNDGFSEIYGESVWLTEFLILSLDSMLPYMRKQDAPAYRKMRNEIYDAFQKYCFEEDRYLRAFQKNGIPIGSKKNKECQIDSLSQAFSTFISVDERSKKAMLTAYNLLYDKEADLFKLFSPPFDDGTFFPGYIAGYCQGFRENGGQYTHGAVFASMGLYKIGEYDKGYEVLTSINPIIHSIKHPKEYLLEPYALSADIYDNENYKGRGGWSQYTGSAGMYLTLILNTLLGYEEENGGFALHPKLSTNFKEFTLKIEKKETVYLVECSLSTENQMLLDGKETENHFLFDKKHHIIKIYCKNPKNSVK